MQTRRNSVLIACCVPTFLISLNLQAGDEQQKHRGRVDSLYVEPHEKNPEPWIKQLPFSEQPLPFPPSPSKTTTLYPEIDLSSDPAPQNEPSVKISRKDPNNAVAAWRDFRTGVTPAVRRIGYTYTSDGGTSWWISTLINPFSQAYPRSSDPAVGVDTAGNFYIATISIDYQDNFGKIIVFKSTDQGLTFASATLAPADTGTAFDDKEYITSDLVPGSPFANNLYISWTRFLFSGGGMMFTRSTNGGASWSHSVQISDPGNEGQGSVPAVGPHGEVYVVWENPVVFFDKSTDGGLTFGTDKPTGLLSAAGFPSIAVDLSGGPRHGTIYVVATDLRFGDEDILLTSSSDGGTTWSTAVRVNDDSVGNGKIQYWPWMAVDDAGDINIVYFDTRNTPNSNTTETYFARSTDGGQTFTNELLSSQQSVHNIPNADVRFGDYIGMDAWKGKAIPVWTDERTGNFDMEIYTSQINIPTPTVTNDYRPYALTGPASGSQVVPGTTVSPITATFQNSGFYAQQDSVDVQYRILLGNTEFYSNTKRIPGLGFGELKEVTFDGSYSPCAEGTYTLQAIVNAGDQVPSNDTLVGTLLAVYPFSVDVSIGPRWSIVSVPVQRCDMSVHSVFPPAMINTTYIWNPIYVYEHGYLAKDTLVPGRGYWMRFSNGTGVQNIRGNRLQYVTDTVYAGWNLVGSVDHVVPVPSGGMVVGSAYEYNWGYRVATSIRPGHGYWIKVMATGLLTLGPTASPKNASQDIESCAQLKLIDNLGREQVLYIADGSNGTFNPADFEMPPPAPEGNFDVRFASNRILESVPPQTERQLPIQLKGVSYPLAVAWKPASATSTASINVGGREYTLHAGRTTEIVLAGSQLLLTVSSRPRTPADFALYQNYPNPFNPSTEVRFDVPRTADVMLKVYNLLGQTVALLVNEKKSAGTYTVNWDASSMPSGMYFYRLSAGSFTETRKMVFLK